MILKILLNTENSFLKIISFLVLLIPFHFSAIAMDKEWPLALLYGPTLFYTHLDIEKNRNAKRIFFIISIPFVFLAMSYSFLSAGGKPIDTLYLPVYRALIVVFFTIIPIMILARKNRWEQPISHLKSLLIQQISVISIVIGFFSAVLLIDTYLDYSIEFDSSPLYIIAMLLCLSFILLARYIYQEILWEIQVQPLGRIAIKQADIAGKSGSLPKELQKEYAERVHHCLETDKLYLRCGLSIELLAQETNISRLHLSQLFRGYYGRNFYHVVAEYRIKWAIRLMDQSDRTLTIEAIAYECGFGSKTTFNKHFKEITGYLPSEFENLQVIS